MNPRIKVTLAMLIYGSLGVFVTQLSLPSADIVLARAVIGFAALMVVLLASGKLKRSKISAGGFLMMLFIGAMIGVNWLMLFDAYKYTFVSTATVLYYLEPVFAIILSTIVLKTKATKNQIIGIVLALAGMLLINGVSFGGSNPSRGMALSIAAAIMYAVIIIVNKASKCTDNLDSLVMTAIEMLGAALVMIIYVAFSYNGEFAGLDAKSILILITLGIVHTAFAYALFFSSVKALDAGTLSILGYVDPASALFFSAFILGERMNAYQWLGAALILGGALFAQLGPKPRKHK